MVLFQLVLLTTGAVKGQDPYYWKLTDENGLPSQTVYQVMQDRNGLIWIATANGICSFDGKLVQNYDCSALNDQEILKIQEDQEGNIWGLNLSGQLFCLSGGKVSVVYKLGEIVIRKITDFYIIQNLLYFGDFVKIGVSSNMYCYNIDEKSTSKLHDNLNGLLFSIYPMDSNLLLYSRSSFYSYVYMLETKNNNKISIADSVYLPSSKHICLFQNQILVPLDNGKIRLINLNKNYQNNDYSIVSPTKNLIVIGSYIYLLMNKGFIKTDLIHEKNYFLDKRINSIFLDREGNYYYSTNEGVLIQPTRNQSQKGGNSYLIHNGKVNSIIKLKTGQILSGNDDGEIRGIGEEFSKNTFGYSAINYLSEVASNKPLLVGADNGLFLKGNMRPLVKTSVKCIYSNKTSTFFGASQIFGKISGNKFYVIKQLRTYAISETRDGMIWVGSDKGIYTYDGKNFKPFIDNVYKCHFPFRVTDMKTDAHGKLWVTTIGHGVLVISNKKIENIFNKNYKLTTNTIYCVTFDDDKVWLGTAKGVFRCQYKSKNFLNINKYYGLPSDEIFALCADKENLLIGTSKGLVSMPYDVMEPNLIPPNIHLKRLMVNDSALSLSKEKHRLKYWQNNLFIEYISYQYRSKGDARYEYRISELDTNWTITDQRYLKFTNLSPGSYHFEIRAVNECDVRSNDVIRLYFDIAKPVWLEWWFLLGSVASAGFGAWYISYKTFKNRQKILEKEGEFKARIEDLRNQALQAQMNPHFIFNSLNAVQHYLSQNDKDNAVRFLSKFAGLIRMVFEFSKRKEISLNSELEMLDLYLSLEQLRFEKTLELIYEVSDELKDNQEAILLPPLLIQPIIENSFRHGLFHKNDKGKLIVKFELVYDHHLKCTVEDDGVGRKKAESMPSWKPSQYSSSGLISTEERIKYWHQKNNTGISDCFTIEDLYSNNKACGTRVTMIL